MKLGIPEFIVTALILTRLGFNLKGDFELKDGKSTNVIGSILAAAISIALLYWGGFYD